MDYFNTVEGTNTMQRIANALERIADALESKQQPNMDEKEHTSSEKACKCHTGCECMHEA